VIVLDASAAVDLLVSTARGTWVAEHLERVDDAHAPHVLDIEVVHALRRLTLAGRISDDRGSRAAGRLAELVAVRYPHGPFLPRIWELRDTVSAYDAAYVALAEALDAPLLTTDGRLAGAPGVRARIISP
jgi:predicted nucleic acid-binding protein